MKQALFSVVASMVFAGSVLSTEIETKSLDALYADAIAEGGELVIRADGDQVDYGMDMFKERFPEIKVIHCVDLSFCHASRCHQCTQRRRWGQHA